jgi:hypothetical protein
MFHLGQLTILRVNKEVLALAEEKAKHALWKKRKFISDPEEEMQAALYVLNLLDLPQHKESEDTKYSFAETYKGQIKKALFKQRNYVTSEFKKLAWMFFKGKFQFPIPTVEEIIKCATRDIRSDREMVVFRWYWEHLLPKMVGSNEWGKNVRLYNTISGATCGNNNQEKVVSPQDEAMCVLLWDNCFERWGELWAFTQDPANQGEKQPIKNGKYTVTDKGQAEWGGWIPDGLQAFNNYYTQIRDVRGTEAATRVEKACLQELRKAYNITFDNSKIQEKEVRRQKRLEKAGKEPLIVPNNGDLQRVVKTLGGFYDE